MFKRLTLNSKVNIRNEGNKYVFFNPATRGLHFISKEAYDWVILATKMSFDNIITELSKKHSVESTSEFKLKLETFYRELIERRIVFVEN